MNLQQLKDKLTSLGITFNATATKAELQALLDAHNASVPPVINREVVYLGASSSGRNFEYGVTDAAFRAELVAAGVTFSSVAGRENSFYCATDHYEAQGVIGTMLEVTVAGFSPAPGRNVNYFNSIDKIAQKQYAKDKQDKETLGRMNLAKAAGHDSLALYKADNLKAELDLLKAQLKKLQSVD